MPFSKWQISPEMGQVPSTSTGSASHSDPLSTYVAFDGLSDRTELSSADVELPPANSLIKFPIFMMPIARNENFVGRKEDLRRIEHAFLERSPNFGEFATPAASTPRTFAICGPGGMGKTELAAEFVFKCRNHFDAVFWINADKAAKVAEGFGKIASELKLIGNDSPDLRDSVLIRDLVRGWLVNPLKATSPSDEESQRTASWILIFDNSDDPGELEDYWPLNGSGCVLFTSRYPYTKSSLYLVKEGIDLKPFNTDEGLRFLSKVTKREDSGAKVTEVLGGLPLAMTQIAAVIVRRTLSFDEFVRHYEDEESHREIFEHRAHLKSPFAGYKHNLASVWAFESLKHGAVLLNTLAFLDPDGIHERILNQNPPQATLDQYPRTTTTYFKARGELLQSSLVVKDLTGRIVIHRLVQDAARSKMSEEQYRDQFMTALTLVSSVWPHDAFGWRHETARWRACEELFPHVLRLKDLSRYIQPNLGEFPKDLTFIKLMTDAGWYHHENGNSAEATAFFEAAKVAAERLRVLTSIDSEEMLLQQIDETMAEIHHNLGCVGTETNNPETALMHFQTFKSLIVDGRLSEPDSTDLRVSIAWNELGNAWMLNKDWRRGERCFEESIRTIKDSSNCDPTDMSFPMVNLGLAYWLTERLLEAASLLEEGLKDRENKFGKDDKVSFITGRFLHALGNVKKSQGFQEESFEYHKRALKQYLSTLGKNHHRTGDMHVKVAEHHLLRDQLEDARTHLDDALQIFKSRDALRPEHCRALLKRSVVLYQDGQAAAAKVDREKSSKIYRELRPESTKLTEDITGDDVDDVVAFWAR